MESHYDPILNEEATSENLDEKKAKKNATQAKRTFAAYLGVSIPEILNFGTIFFMHFSKAFLDFLFNTPMRFVVFPAAAIYGLVKAALSWNSFRLVRKDKKATREDKTISFLQALWETLNGLGTTGAVVTGIVGFFIGASVGMGISITFNFFLAASTAICASYTAYYGITAYRAYKAWKKESPEGDKTHPLYLDFKSRRDKAITNGIITGIVALLTLGVILAMVTGFPVVGAAIGIIGCLCGAAFSAYSLYKLMKSRKSKSEDKEPLLKGGKNPNEIDHTTNAKMQRKIGLPRTQSLHDLSIHAKQRAENVNEPCKTSPKSALRKSKSLNDLSISSNLTTFPRYPHNSQLTSSQSPPSSHSGLRKRKGNHH